MRSFLIADICPELFVDSTSLESHADLDTSESSEASTPSSLIGRASPEHRDNRKSPKGRNPDRPSFSYNALIAMAIQSSPTKRMTLSEIYAYICANYPYYASQTDKQWQNSVRHNLSLHKEFVKVPNANGRGNSWAMTDTAGMDMYISTECGKFKRRTRTLPTAPMQFAPPVLPFQFPFPVFANPNLIQTLMKGPHAL